MAEDPQTAKITYKTRVLNAFWPHKTTSEVNICKNWPPFCRFFVEMASSAEQRVSKPQSTTKIGVWEPPHEKTFIFELKNGFRTRERSIFGEIEASKRGFEANMAKKWFPFCRMFASMASVLQNGGGRNRQIL